MKKMIQIFAVCTVLLFLKNNIYATNNDDQYIHESNVTPGTVVLLNGTSSAGKSTLLYALHQNYYPDFYIARIDDFIKTPAGKNPKTKYHNFYTHIKEMALSGKSVLVDTVSYQLDHEKYNGILKPCRVIKILVYCPLDGLIMHVQSRNKLANTREHRIINLAFWQYLTLYTMKTSSSDIVIDQMTPAQVKQAIAQSKDMAKTLPWRKARNLKKINKDITKEFDIKKSSQKIDVTPKLPWDFVINTHIHSPEILAQIVVDYIEAQF